MYPDLAYHRRQRRGGLVYTYDVTLPVESCEARRVRIEFTPALPQHPRVYVDGPSGVGVASPHRYADRELCLWYPRDGAKRRWVPDDGLHLLLALICTHLFKEAYWRSTGEWLGDEAPHDPPPERGAARPHVAARRNLGTPPHESS